jgi:hypothetical protein
MFETTVRAGYLLPAGPDRLSLLPHPAPAPITKSLFPPHHPATTTIARPHFPPHHPATTTIARPLSFPHHSTHTRRSLPAPAAITRPLFPSPHPTPSALHHAAAADPQVLRLTTAFQTLGPSRSCRPTHGRERHSQINRRSPAAPERKS